MCSLDTKTESGPSKPTWIQRRHTSKPILSTGTHDWNGLIEACKSSVQYTETEYDEHGCYTVSHDNSSKIMQNQQTHPQHSAE